MARVASLEARSPVKYLQNCVCFSTPPLEDLLVLVLEGKVEGLRGKVADDFGQVAPPEGRHTLLLGDAHDAVHDAFVLLVNAICLLVCCTCNNSLTHSMGATAILEMAAVMPLARKSLAKEIACSSMVSQPAQRVGAMVSVLLPQGSKGITGFL